MRQSDLDDRKVSIEEQKRRVDALVRRGTTTRCGRHVRMLSPNTDRNIDTHDPNFVAVRNLNNIQYEKMVNLTQKSVTRAMSQTLSPSPGIPVSLNNPMFVLQELRVEDEARWLSGNFTGVVGNLVTFIKRLSLSEGLELLVLNILKRIPPVSNYGPPECVTVGRVSSLDQEKDGTATSSFQKQVSVPYDFGVTSL